MPNVTTAVNMPGGDARSSFRPAGKDGRVAAAVRDPARQPATLPAPGYAARRSPAMLSATRTADSFTEASARCA